MKSTLRRTINGLFHVSHKLSKIFYGQSANKVNKPQRTAVGNFVYYIMEYAPLNLVSNCVCYHRMRWENDGELRVNKDLEGDGHRQREDINSTLVLNEPRNSSARTADNPGEIRI
jgi:hypothetical protein